MTFLEKLHRIYTKRVLAHDFKTYQLIGQFDDSYKELLWELEKVVFVLDIEDQGKVYFTTERIIWEGTSNLKETDNQKVAAFLTKRTDKELDWRPLETNYLQLDKIETMSPMLDRKGDPFLFKTRGHIIPLYIACESGEYGQILMESGTPVTELWNILLDFNHRRNNLEKQVLRKLMYDKVRESTRGIMYLDLSFSEQVKLLENEFKDISFDDSGKIICYWDMVSHYSILGLNGVLLVNKSNQHYDFISKQHIDSYFSNTSIFDSFQDIKDEIHYLTSKVTEVLMDKKRLLMLEVD